MQHPKATANSLGSTGFSVLRRTFVRRQLRRVQLTGSAKVVTVRIVAVGLWRCVPPLGRSTLPGGKTVSHNESLPFRGQGNQATTARRQTDAGNNGPFTLTV